MRTSNKPIEFNTLLCLRLNIVSLANLRGFALFNDVTTSVVLIILFFKIDCHFLDKDVNYLLMIILY